MTRRVAEVWFAGRPERLARLQAALAALRTRRSPPAFRDLPVLDDEHPLYEGVSDLAGALSQLVDRRAARFHDVLASRCRISTGHSPL